MFIRMRQDTDEQPRTALSAKSWFVFVIAGSMSISACETTNGVSVEPFQKYHASVVQLGVSAETALAVEQDLVYKRYMESWQSVGTFDQLQLEPAPGGSPFAMQLTDAPLFQTMQEARARLGDLNDLVVQYAELLLVLAGAADTSVAVDAETVAGDLRTSAEALASSINLNVEIDGGWFFGFGALARQYAESKRKDLLVDLIRSSDDEIRALATAGKQISQLSALGIQTEYQASFSKLTADVARLSNSGANERVETILALNAETLRQLNTLKLLHDAYDALPSAHSTLQQSVRDGSQYSLTTLLTYAESLNQRYDQFTED